MLNPWFTRQLGDLINMKSTYFNLLRDGVISKEENNRFKNKVKLAVRKSKSDYFNKMLMTILMIFDKLGKF